MQMTTLLSLCSSSSYLLSDDKNNNSRQANESIKTFAVIYSSIGN